jgi:hypothetical protein
MVYFLSKAEGLELATLTGLEFVEKVKPLILSRRETEIVPTAER